MHYTFTIYINVLCVCVNYDSVMCKCVVARGRTVREVVI